MLPCQQDTTKEDFGRLDGGPIPRQFLARTDGLFDGWFTLALHDKLIRGQLPQSDVRMAAIIVMPSRFDDGLWLGERGELAPIGLPRSL